MRWLNTPENEELQKLTVLKEELGELSASDEKKFRTLKSNTERHYRVEAQLPQLQLQCCFRQLIQMERKVIFIIFYYSG